MHSTKTKTPKQDRQNQPPHESIEGIDGLVKDVLYPPPRHDISKSVILVLAELLHVRHSSISDRNKITAIWRIFCSPSTSNKPLPTWAKSGATGDTDTQAEPTSEDIWLQTVLEMPYRMQLELAITFPLGRRILAVNADETLPPPVGSRLSRAGVMLAPMAQTVDCRPAPAWIPSWQQIKQFPTSAWESWFKLCLQAEDLPRPTLDIASPSLNSNMHLELSCAVVLPRCKPSRVTVSSWSDPVVDGTYKVYILDRATGYKEPTKVPILINVPGGVTQEMILSPETGWRKVYLPEPYDGPRSEQRYTLVTWVGLREELAKQLYYSGSEPKILVPWVVCKLVDPDTGEEAKWEGETWKEPNPDEDDDDEEEEEEGVVNREEEEAGSDEQQKRRHSGKVDGTHENQNPEVAAAKGDGIGDGWIYLRKVGVLVEEVDRSSSMQFWGGTYKDDMMTGVKCRFV